MLVSNHIESVIEVIWDQLALLLICSSLTPISVVLLALLPLLIGFSIDDWFVVADVENQISSSGWKNQKTGKTWRVRREIQVVIVILGA